MCGGRRREGGGCGSGYGRQVQLPRGLPPLVLGRSLLTWGPLPPLGCFAVSPGLDISPR